jgi:nitrogen fixation protein NifU and related proteins
MADADLSELYHDVVKEHGKSPRNYRVLAGANRHAEGYNPLCGDRFTVFADVENDMIRDISFQGAGCNISTASASIMTQLVKGKSVKHARDLFELFHGFMIGHVRADNPDLGKLTVFSGVPKFPMRVKCATLAWHTLEAALERKQEKISTE